MSSMLEQAIIDAAALREAALKSAEHAVIEKYAPEIKAAMASLLENSNPRFSRGQVVRHEGRLATITVENDDGRIGIQEIEGGKTYLVQESDIEDANEGLLQEEDVEESAQPEMENSVKEAPLAAVDIEQEGIQEGDQVIFEFTADDFLEEDSAKGESGLDTMADSEEEVADVAQSETGVGGDSATDDPVLNLNEEEESLQELIDILNEFEEEVPLEEEEEVPLEEELVVDMKGQHKDGTFQTDAATLNYYQEMELAKREATKYKEENEELNKKLEESDKNCKRTSIQNSKFKKAINNLNEKLQSTLLSNAKLLYSNRALNDASLNERQKTKIVEAINKAHSVEEAKNLHETLRVTVGQSQRRGPKSLSETVSRKSNLASMLTSKRQDVAPVDNFSERMRRLAGIK